MRRAHVAPGFRSAGFMTPPLGGAGENACATLGGWQSARPVASRVKGISPPSCRKRALRAVSVTGCEFRTRLIAAPIVLCCRLVAFGATFRAILVPVGTFAPSARGPLVTPLFVRIRARALGIGGPAARLLAAILLAAYSKSMRRTWIGFKFSTYITHFCITQHAAGSRYGEVQIADAGGERQLHVE
eukprot:2888885-Pleurochrysis_carterae.AAC.1